MTTQPAGMKALVTGGTGFIGSHIVEALLKRGFEVRCLVRDPDRTGWLLGLPVEFVRGDCTDPASLVGLMDGMDYVFHSAGLTKAVRDESYFAVNAEGTKNLAEAAARDGAGLRKAVYISSQAAAGPSEAGRPRREDDPPAPVSAYGRSKLKAEEYARVYADRLDTVIVRPTSVYGPRDTDVYAFFKLVSNGIKTTFFKERLVSLCYVDDLVEGILAAAFGKTESGEAYFIAHESPMDWDGIGVAVEAALGVKARRIIVPVPLMSVVALVSEAAARISGRPALLNRQKMAEIRQRYWVADTGKAKDRLDFRARHDFAAGAKLTADWYRLYGWI